MLRNLTLIVNAGGQSRRMGQSKALLPIPPRGEPLIAHLVRRLQPLAPARLVVVTNDAELPARRVCLPMRSSCQTPIPIPERWAALLPGYRRRPRGRWWWPAICRW